ncbi:MAG: MBL fold metallo-hydrolase [Elusimicrobia bacterium]|nr:MBL fold metallo-hydrolase [Elusimicrobiota bacterium]
MTNAKGISRAVLSILLSGAPAFSWPAPLCASETLESAASQDFLGGLPGSSIGTALNFSVPELPSPAAIETGSAEVSLGAGLKVFFINVFQGDAEYIELPNGKTVLIDAGPAPDPESQYTTPIVSNFLTRRGVKKIDYMVLTHPHADHYGGMKWVFEELQVDNFYDTGIDNSAAVEDETVRRKAKEEPGCAVSYPAQGDSLDWASGVASSSNIRI